MCAVLYMYIATVHHNATYFCRSTSCVQATVQLSACMPFVLNLFEVIGRPAMCEFDSVTSHQYCDPLCCICQTCSCKKDTLLWRSSLTL